MKFQIKNKNNNRWYDVDEGAVVTQCKDETLDSATISISNLSEEIDIEPYDICVLEYENTRSSITYAFCVNSFVKTQICLQPRLYKYEITLFSLVKQLEGVILPNLKITKIKGITRSIWSYMQQYLSEYCPRIKVGTSKNDYRYVQKWLLDPSFESKFSDECPEMQWNQPTLREVLNDLAMLKDCIITLDGNNRIRFMDLTQVYVPSPDALSGINYIQESKSSEDYVSDLRMNLVNVTNNSSEGTNNYVTKSEVVSINTEDNAIMTSENCVLMTQYPIYKIKKLEMIFAVNIPLGYYDDDNNYIQNIFSRCWIKQDLMDATLLDTNSHGITVLAAKPTHHNQLVFEYKEWQVKDALYTDGSNTIKDNDYPKYKEGSLYFVRGSRTIQGWNQKYNLGTMISNTLLTRLKENLTCGLKEDSRLNKTIGSHNYKYYVLVDPNSSSSPVYNRTSDKTGAEYTYYGTYFHIEYETLEGSSFKAGKDIIKENDDYYPRHQREVIDNQTNSYIDSYSQGFLEYQKANRLGNVQKMINARYFGEQDGQHMLSISDLVDGSVIYKCEYQFYKQHIEVNALATKDYVLRNYFTGVKAKIRSWNIVSGNEALTRTDIDKWYLEFSYNRKIDQGLFDYYITDYNLPNYFISAFSTGVKPLKYAFLYTEDSDNNKYPSDESNDVNYYQTELISRIIGNSLVFTFAMKDNYWFDKYIDTNKFDVNVGSDVTNLTSITVLNYVLKTNYTNIGGIPTQYYKYTDNNGEFTHIYWFFANDIFSKSEDIIDVGTNIGQNNGTIEGQVSRSFIKYCCERPKVPEVYFKYGNDYDYTKFLNMKTMHKDSQEITNISTQFEFCKDTNNICFTRAFIERQEAIRTVYNSHTYSLIVAASNTYNFRNPQVPSTIINRYDNISIGDSVNYSNLSCEFGPTIEEYVPKSDLLNKAIYLVDENDALLIAFNNIPEANIDADSNNNYTSINIYLNLLKTRDYDIYDSQVTQNVVDKL